jgi:hypothetical protein
MNEDEGNERANLSGIDYYAGKALGNGLVVLKGRLPSSRAQHPHFLEKKVRKLKKKLHFHKKNVNGLVTNPEILQVKCSKYSRAIMCHSLFTTTPRSRIQ